MACFNLKDYINGWNKFHAVKFRARMSQDNHLVGISVRYPVEPYGESISRENWEVISGTIETQSDGTMMILSNYRMARNGILDILLSSESSTYDTRTIANTLKWLGKELARISQDFYSTT